MRRLLTLALAALTALAGCSSVELDCSGKDSCQNLAVYMDKDTAVDAVNPSVGADVEVDDTTVDSGAVADGLSGGVL